VELIPTILDQLHSEVIVKTCSSPKLQPRPETGRFWWSRREYDYRLGTERSLEPQQYGMRLRCEPSKSQPKGQH